MSDVVYDDAKKEDFLRNEIPSKQLTAKKKRVHLDMRLSGDKQVSCEVCWSYKVGSIYELCAKTKLEK